MGFKDCLVSLAAEGDITKEEAAFLADEFEERFAQARLSLGDGPAAGAAREKLIADLKADAAEQKRQAHLTEATRLGLKEELQGYRNASGEPDVYEASLGELSHYGFRGMSSMRGKSEAIIAMAHGKLADLMFTFDRTPVLGRRKNMVTAADMVREMRGENTGNALAKALGENLSEVFEYLRQRFNNAGGSIPKLLNWGMPQTHDAARIRALGKTAVEAKAVWKSFIGPLLDPDKMISPLTGQPVGAGGLDKALDYAADSILTGNWAHMQPAMRPQGRGKLASQRQDERFLVFRTADDWLVYNERFGTGDVIQTAFDHINSMAKDIAAMEKFGPNPDAMVAWMTQVVRHEIAQADLGKASFARPTGKVKGWAEGKGNPGAVAAYRIESLYDTLRGRPTVMGGVAKSTADIRNLANSAMLGAAGVTASVTDPFVAASARRLADLPVWKPFGQLFAMMSKQNRKDIVASAVIWDDFMHTYRDEARMLGVMTGSDWSKYLVDRSMTLFGLKPVTTARQLLEARIWHREIASQSGTEWADLTPRFRAAMEGFGISASDWLVMQKSVDPDGLVTPMSIVGETGNRDVAEKLAELTMSWRERSVPSGTPNTRSMFTGKVPRGTMVGETAEFFLQFKSFGLSFAANQIEAISRYALNDSRGAKIGAAHYASTLLIGLTIGGAIAQQLIGLSDGKDPEDMTTASFWGKAFLKGGGFGIFGDMLQANTNRFGTGLAGMLAGPGAALLSDTVQLPFDMLNSAEGKTAKPAIDFAGRYTPILPSFWATRGAWRRMVLDQLQWLADPKAHQSFRAKERDLRKRTGQDYFWRPGDPLPAREPDLSHIGGN